MSLSVKMEHNPKGRLINIIVNTKAGFSIAPINLESVVNSYNEKNSVTGKYKIPK